MTARTAVVTGVGRQAGIGAAIARRLAGDGWDLVLSYWHPYDDRLGHERAPDEVDRLAEELRAQGRTVVLLPADLQRPEVPDQLLAAAGEACGEVTALVLSHAESIDSGILDTSVESFDRHVAVNARASWLLVAAFARQLTSGDGRVVALTSDHTAGNLPYGASKGALDRIVIAAAQELAHLGVIANVVNPGPVDTGWMDDATREVLTAKQPTGRLGTPEDAANLVSFLLSEQGAWVNGQLLHSNGGFTG